MGDNPKPKGKATFRFGSTMYKNNSRDSREFKGCSPL